MSAVDVDGPSLMRSSRTKTIVSIIASLIGFILVCVSFRAAWSSSDDEDYAPAGVWYENERFNYPSSFKAYKATQAVLGLLIVALVLILPGSLNFLLRFRDFTDDSVAGYYEPPRPYNRAINRMAYGSWAGTVISLGSLCVSIATVIWVATIQPALKKEFASMNVKPTIAGGFYVVVLSTIMFAVATITERSNQKTNFAGIAKYYETQALATLPDGNQGYAVPYAQAQTQQYAYAPMPSPQYPGSAGQYPPYNNQYPQSNSQYPQSHGQYPQSNGQYPQSNSQYPGNQYPPRGNQYQAPQGYNY